MPVKPSGAVAPSSRRIDHVVIIGAGFSGSLQAINLLRHEGPRATLIERRPHVGRGVAYSAAHPDHLLNVRAERMSALPDDPDHFVRWLRQNGRAPDGFVSRITYGDYLRDLLDEAAARSKGRLAIRTGEALDILFEADRATVVMDDGSRIDADAVVLALGNLLPHELPAVAGAGLAGDVYMPDPWAADIADGLDDNDVVLAIGSGLTMVDVALLLAARGFGGRTIAISRRGLMPRAHAVTAAAPSNLTKRPTLEPAELLRFVRRRAGPVGWHNAVDELRPYTQSMWLAASPEHRARFLRHLRPWWDVHRHRLAPGIAGKVQGMMSAGSLRTLAGKIVAIEPDGRGARVIWRPRGAADVQTMRVRRIINCSGPQGDLTRTAEPLLRRLLARALIRPDVHHLGMDVNQQSEVIAQDGTANPRLLALGPMTRGAFWEIVAVPDIRVQTWSVARRLSNAHWVEGEGL